MKTCKKCGGVERYASGHCKACSRVSKEKWKAANVKKFNEDITKWRVAHPEKVRAAKAKWYASNPGRVKEYRKENSKKINAANAKWRALNPEKAKASIERWNAEHPEAKRIYCQNRRARKRANGGILSRGLAEKLFALQKGKCPCCALPLGSDYHLDHRMPLALGGANEDWNMQLLRAFCNNQKKAKHPVEFMQSRGFLL